MAVSSLTSGGILNNEEFINNLRVAVSSYKIIHTNKKVSFYNIPAALDIETTSMYSTRVEKVAFMYEATLGINGLVTVVRTWEDLLHLLNEVCDIMNTSEVLQLVIYIQNLGYEFQFMRKLFDWKKVFSLDVRKPVSALTTSGILFKCSYKLSNYSLKYIGKNLQKYKCEKMDGDLDYSLIRNSKTPLTEKEWKYCENDVRVVMCFIQEEIEKCGDITRIPLTKTGYVRNYCRNSCMFEFKSHKKGGKKYRNYRNLMNSLVVSSADEYSQLKRAFQGGFTHANANHSGKTMYNVGSFDFTSSYPYTMVSEKFPMSTAERVTINSVKEFEDNLQMYCCLFDAEFTDIESITYIEHPLSSSKCNQLVEPIIDNGRIVSAKHCFTTITEQDWMVFKHFYHWKDVKIYNFRRYKKGYLPTDFVKAILKLYQDKTMLKGVEGKEVEYLKSKEMINSAYGMTVTDICRDEILYSTRVEWLKEKPDIANALEKYNKSSRRFLFYPWGVWVTAYARRNLFTGIYAIGDDYVYSDTDSIKLLHPEAHMNYIEAYNNRAISKLDRAMDYHKFPHDFYKPKTTQGKEKILGIWDDEGIYTRFKTIGAKRYIVEKDGVINITVSGVNKQKAVPYLLSKYGNNIFEAFSDGLHIPAEFTGKNTLTYIDDPVEGDAVDYLGNKAHYYSPSSIHMEGADYSMSISAMYAEYLLGLKESHEELN